MAELNESSDAEMMSYLFGRVEKKEEQVLKLEASVFQVANYYFVFQGVIFTAIIKGASGGSLKCQHFWLPLSISAIGAALNFGTLLMIAAKYKEALDEVDERVILVNNALSRVKTMTMHNQLRVNKTWRGCIMVLSMFLFFIFALLNLFAAWFIPCW